MNDNQFIDRLIDSYQDLVKKATNSALDYKDDPLNVIKYEKYMDDISNLKDIIDFARVCKMPAHGMNLLDKMYKNITNIVDG